MSAFTFVYNGGSARLPPSGGTAVSVFGYASAAATINATGQQSASPAQPYIDPPNNFLPIIAIGAWGIASAVSPWPSLTGTYAVLSGHWSTLPFASMVLGAPFSTTYTAASVTALDTTFIPGCTIAMWSSGGNPSASGQTVTVDFTGVVEPSDAVGSSFQYQPPTAVIGVFDPLLLVTALSWTASVDGIPQTFTTNGTYSVDASALIVKVGGVGAGAGGSSGGFDGGYVGGGASGSGGSYGYGEYLINGLSGTVTVTVPAGGAGGASNSSGAHNYGVNGSTTSFGGFVLAGGGIAATSGNSTVQQPGGVATVLGGANVTLESGGVNGTLSTNTNDDFSRAGGATTKAGGGGGGGSRSGNSAGNPIAPNFNNPGGNSAVSTGGTAGASAFNYAGNGNTFVTASPGVAGGSVGPFGGAGGGGGGYAFGDAGTGGNVTIVTGRGGDGGVPGGGGGGGGGGTGNPRGVGSTLTATYGAGGNGGRGVVQLTTYWKHSHAPQYIVYRNGVPIAVTGQGAVSFNDINPPGGANIYKVVASYDGINQNSDFSTPISVPVGVSNVNVFGTFVGDVVSNATCLVNVGNIKPKIYMPLENTKIRSSG